MAGLEEDLLLSWKEYIKDIYCHPVYFIPLADVLIMFKIFLYLMIL